MQVQHGSPVVVVPKQHPSHIRVVLPVGDKRDVYDGDVVGDSLMGYGAAVGGAAQLDRIALAIADVRQIELSKPDAGRTGALIAGVVIGTVIAIRIAHICWVGGSWDRSSGSCKGGFGFLDGI